MNPFNGGIMHEIKNMEAFIRAQGIKEFRIIPLADRCIVGARFFGQGVYGTGSDLDAAMADIVVECRKVRMKLTAFDKEAV